MTAQMLGLDEAAQRLGVHDQTAYGWVRSGELRAELTGGRYRIAVADVDRLRRHRARPARPPVLRPREGFAPLAQHMFGLLAEDHELDRVVRTVTAGHADATERRTANLLERRGVRVLVGHPGARLDDLQDRARS